MSKMEEKLKALFGERETIINEMSELKHAYDIRQQKLFEIGGSIKTLQELLNEDLGEINNEENTTEK